jgi:hypothetical protein
MEAGHCPVSGLPVRLWSVVRTVRALPDRAPGRGDRMEYEEPAAEDRQELQAAPEPLSPEERGELEARETAIEAELETVRRGFYRIGSEGQVRPLLSLAPEQRRAVWQAAVEETEGGQPTGRQVQSARERLYPRLVALPPVGDPPEAPADVLLIYEGQQVTQILQGKARRGVGEYTIVCRPAVPKTPPSRVPEPVRVAICDAYPNADAELLVALVAVAARLNRETVASLVELALQEAPAS